MSIEIGIRHTFEIAQRGHSVSIATPTRVSLFRLGPWAACVICGCQTRAHLEDVAVCMVHDVYCSDVVIDAYDAAMGRVFSKWRNDKIERDRAFALRVNGLPVGAGVKV